MPRTWLAPALHGCCIGATVLVGLAHAQSATVRSTISEVSLPGGLRPALLAIGDELAPDRAQFLVEYIRRTYDNRIALAGDRRNVSLQALLSEIKEAAPTGPADTLPLPLTVSFWTDTVFGGRATPQTLVSHILQSRDAALLYCGLLSLDDDTRQWMAGQPELIGHVTAGRSSAFLAAAPGLRMTPSGLQLPGGPLARAAWEALVGRRSNDPAAFVRALLDADDGLLAWFVGALAPLTPSQVGVALHLGSPGVMTVVESARLTYAVHRRLFIGRPIEQRAFTRPALDPALLTAELSRRAGAQPALPGTRALWNAAFLAETDTAAVRAAGSRGADGRQEPVDLPWLADQTFKGEQGEQRRRYAMVMFASRRFDGSVPTRPGDAIEAIRAAASYPALSTALERAGVTDLAIFADAARRAAALSAIEDNDRAARAIAQFQGGLALLTRAASRGSLSPGAVSERVSSLSAVAVSKDGNYEGRLVRWLRDLLSPQTTAGDAVRPGSADDVLEHAAAGPLERSALRLLAGPAIDGPRLFEWEGTRYRLDLAKAEAIRLVRVLGDAPRPYLSSADAALRLADALEQPGLPREQLRLHAQELARIAQVDAEAADEPSGATPERPTRDLVAKLQQAAGAGDIGKGARLAPALRLLADDLLARGLTELAYAAALSPRDVAASAAETARRHDFGARPSYRAAPWRLPRAGTDLQQRWRVSGALLDLDVGLSEYSLVLLSSRPPARRPSLNDVDRRAFIDAVALVRPASLADDDRDTIVTAIRRGRTRLEAARTPADALAIADAAGLSSLRRALLPWVVEHDPARRSAFLSPTELLWLGLETDDATRLDAWGAPGGLRDGCLCLSMIDRRPWETFAGRDNSGAMASAFPDLNLRLAEHLADLRMPAALQAPVLAAATADFVNSVISRDPDDHRGLVEFVQTLSIDRVEQYLALLTTDGPLVPVQDTPAPATAARSRQPIPSVTP